ncbi:MAG TPA: sulfate adenylyltransferase [Bryobacterales bacterium]|nr:sulfate adenylyltransferase [Bryobacterales bacterium]
MQATFKQLSDLFLLSEGGYEPVTGFQPSREVRSVAETMHLTTGEPWSIPVIFPISGDQAKALRGASELVLRDGDDQPAGRIHIQEIFPLDKDHYARHVFRTTDSKHPGVAWLESAGEFSVAGPVEMAPGWKLDIPGGLPISPREVRGRIAERGWKKVVAFQTRNPIHRAHEFVSKVALETADGLVIHPLLGETKPDDIPAKVRLDCYRALLENYYSPGHTFLAGFPAWMRYAGPREAIFHAQVRRNYGFTHLIVGRDHAGVGKFYGPFDAQKIFSEFAPGELGIDPIFFDTVHYCRKCGGMTSPKTCPHGAEHHVSLSGTAVRKMLSEGQTLPPEFSRPEVARILLAAGARA